MKDPIIYTENLSKVYRLYSKPHYRFLDMFGLLGKKQGAYTEHKALDGINLEIQQGEKVAFIGRNGAGKSTFLKLVTNVTKPTSGRLVVKGKAHALLQIGTGFHPDFTGRENIYAYLAQLGVTGREAKIKCSEIIEFAELEEYIDQPVKTYSTGMGVRLMFSTSTAISPNLLVLDEVLGVGDAYFAQKSYERIQELCDREGTTLLLVSHDVYSASRICDRMIWIDKGRILLDGDGQTVVHAYEQSIRDQEEERLRRKQLATLKINQESQQPENTVMYGQIQRCDREAVQSGVAISHLRFLLDEVELVSASMGDSNNGSEISLISGVGEGNWGEPILWQDRTAREFLNYGSIYHRLPFVVNSQAVMNAVQTGNLKVEVGYYNGNEQELELVLFHPDGVRQFSGSLDVSTVASWLDVKVEIQESTFQARQDNSNNKIKRYGQRALEIVNVQFLDEQGKETFHFGIGSTMKVRLSYRLNDPNFSEFPTLVVAFQKDGIIRSHRFWTDQIKLSAMDAKEGVIEVIADPLLLCRGSYAVTVSVFKEKYFTSNAAKRFFSANEQVYDMHSRAYEIVIKESREFPLCNDVVFQHPSSWILNDIQIVNNKLI